MAPMSGLQRVEVLGGVLVLLLLLGEGWVLLQIMRQQGRLLLRLEALETQQTGASLAEPALVEGTAGSGRRHSCSLLHPADPER